MPASVGETGEPKANTSLADGVSKLMNVRALDIDPIGPSSHSTPPIPSSPKR